MAHSSKGSTVDNDLQQPVEAQRGSDLRTDLDQRFEDLQLPFRQHQARVFERAADGLCHRGKEKQVVFVEGVFLAVDGFEHADLGLVLHERNQQRIGDRLNAAVLAGSGVALHQALIRRVVDQQRFALLRHIRDVAFAGGHGHAHFDGAVIAVRGHQLQFAAFEEPEVNGLAGEHGGGLHRNCRDDGIQFEGGVQ